MVRVLFAGGFLMLGFGLTAAADRSSGAQLQEWQSEAGVVESTEDPRFQVPELAPGPVRRVRENELPEVDFQNLEQIKKRQVPVSDNGARIIKALPTRGGAAPRTAAPGLGINFGGFNVFQAGFIPPDPVMAAGPNHLILAVNLRWQIYSKTGAPGFLTTIQSWFASVNTLNLGYSDPKIIYDPYAGRWIVMCIAYGSPSNPRGAYFLSVSDDSDPNGTWYKWMVLHPNDLTFPDYPGVGYDASEAVYFAANHFSNTTGQYRFAGIVIMKKSQLYANNPAVPPLTVTRFSSMRDPSDNGLTFTIKPALTYGTPISGGFFVNTQGSEGSNIELWRINNPVTAPTLVHRATIPIGSYSAPPDAEQPDDTNLINTNNSTLQSEVWYRDGHLYFAFPQAHNFDSVTVSAIRYMKIDTSGAILQNIIYGAGGEYFFFPANAALNSGNAAMVFSHSSPSSYCGARYVGNFPDDLTAGVLHAGEGSYFLTGGGTRNRWGDYGGISQDPAEPRRVWMYHQYAGPPDSWYTRAGAIMLENHSPLLSDPGPQSVNEGGFLSVYVTANEPDGEPFSYQLLSSSPPYVSFADLGGGQGQLTLAPGCFDAGVDTVYLVASDNATPPLADTSVIEITVLEKNCAPMASVSAPDTIFINQCQSASFLITSFDPEVGPGPISLFGAAVHPFASVTDSGNGKGSLNLLAPTTLSPGLYGAPVFASDGGDSSGVAVLVRVFQKGDLNQDGALAPADVVLLLNCIFLSKPPPAGPDACDMDGGGPGMSDVVVLLNATFLVEPFPPC